MPGDAQQSAHAVGVADELEAERHAVRVAVARDGDDGQTEQLPGTAEDRGARGAQSVGAGPGAAGPRITSASSWRSSRMRTRTLSLTASAVS